MSLLFEPSSLSSCFFEPVVGDEQVSVPEILAMLDGVLEGDLSLSPYSTKIFPFSTQRRGV